MAACSTQCLSNKGSPCNSATNSNRNATAGSRRCVSPETRRGTNGSTFARRPNIPGPKKQLRDSLAAGLPPAATWHSRKTASGQAGRSALSRAQQPPSCQRPRGSIRAVVALLPASELTCRRTPPVATAAGQHLGRIWAAGRHSHRALSYDAIRRAKGPCSRSSSRPTTSPCASRPKLRPSRARPRRRGRLAGLAPEAGDQSLCRTVSGQSMLAPSRRCP